MIKRCYSEKEQEKLSCRSYIGVKVCDEWHNFQNFAQWAKDKEDKFVKGWELDKDLLGTGKLYSPDNCCLLPERINCFLADKYSRKKSSTPKGVSVVESKYPNGKVGYRARCHIKGERVHLGFFDTPEEAGESYRVAKEDESKRLADEYKSVLTEEQYNKLYTLKLEDIT